MEDSKMLRRRKSMGDAVLERNVCFVDVSASTGTDKIVDYMLQQLHNGIMAASSGSVEFLGLLSGRGGAQVDVILYLISNGKNGEAVIADAADVGLRYATSGLRSDKALVGVGKCCTSYLESRPAHFRTNREAEK